MEMKERKNMDPAFQWDLSTLYKDDAAWEKDFAAVDADVDKVAAFQGKLNTAADIRACYDASTALERRFNNLLTYAMLRESEDTRDPAAQALMARGMSKYVAAGSRVSFAEPEILSLPAQQLKKIADDPVMEPYRFALEQLIDEKPHVLSAEEEQIMANFGEVFEAPKEIAT